MCWLTVMTGEMLIFAAMLGIFSCIVLILLLRRTKEDHLSIAPHLVQSSCRPPKILVLIITSAAEARWQNEYQFQMDRVVQNNFTNITFKFVQCGKASEDRKHLTMDCSESFIPGILQKSVLAIKKELKHFDFFVRTNLSTYIHCGRLQSMIALYQFYDKPLYTGGLLWNFGISGTSIVMNQKAADILVSAYSKIKDMKVPDDVVIGTVLKPYLHYTKATKEFEIMYWNFDRTISQNLQQFLSKKTPFIRLKPAHNHLNMQPIYDAIANHLNNYVQ